jgi:hypothetical protein
VAGLDDDRDSFIRTDIFYALSALLTDEFWWLVDYAGNSSYVPETTSTISPFAGCVS